MLVTVLRCRYVVSGAGLWISFVFLRLLNLPLCMYWYYADTVADPQSTWLALHPVLRWVGMPSTFFIWALSCTWFVPITQGLLKAVGVGQNKAGDKKD